MEFLRKLVRRGLKGVELVISDVYEGIKAAVARVFNTIWRRLSSGDLGGEGLDVAVGRRGEPPPHRERLGWRM